MGTGIAPFLAVLQLESKFYRPPGDNGNNSTWEGIPTRIFIVKGATPKNTVQSGPYGKEYLDIWYNVIDHVIVLGAVAIVTGCGFLATLQEKLQMKSSVPIGTSSLLQVPFASQFIRPNQKIGVVTFSAEKLTKRHFSCLGVSEDTPVVGLKEGCSFQSMIYEETEFDFESHRADFMEAVDRLIQTHGNIGGIVLECTNMPPYKHAIKQKYNLPVWDITTLGNTLYEVGLVKSFPQ